MFPLKIHSLYISKVLCICDCEVLSITYNVMKTSPSQFEMLVNFMEQHGDIHKPTKNARGRIQTIQDWEQLSNLLNSDPTGEVKNTDKWKKVWSDLKNNTKKKASRLHRAACGTGGGPALNLQLTELEKRVLNIIGPQAATGLTGVREAGFPQNQASSADRTVTLSPTPPVPTGSSEIIAFAESPVIDISELNTWDVAGPSQTTDHQSPPANTHQELLEVPIELPTSPPAVIQRPTQTGHTPRHRRRGTCSRRIITPRRRVVTRQPNQMERATEHFLNSDEEWRNFLRKKHEDECTIEKEKLRLREMELEGQKKWQDVAMLAIEALHKVIDSRLCKDQ